eukprot:2461984-Amphidinium_carterae.1
MSRFGQVKLKAPSIDPETTNLWKFLQDEDFEGAEILLMQVAVRCANIDSASLTARDQRLRHHTL